MNIFRSFQITICAGLLGVAGLHAQSQLEMAGKPAPDFSRSDLAGHQVDLRNYRGKVVLLNFWATWCAPCQVELPQFEAWQREYAADGLQVITVSMDDQESPVRRTARRLHLDFPVLMGDAELGETYGGVLGLPVTFLIDRHGRIAAQFRGETELGQIESRVKQLLAE